MRRNNMAIEYTIREIVDKTGVSSEAIRDRITKKAIMAVRKGNKYYIPETELAKLPKPRKTGVQASIEQKDEVPTKDGPFSLERYKAETERMKEENKREALRILEKAIAS
jgi:hypothetical protein